MRWHGRVWLTALLFISINAGAFDGEISIDDVNLKQENWLDIQTYSFRKSLDQQWNDGQNGLRFTGGSVGADHLFLQTELRYRQPLSEQLDMRLGWEEERFYAAEDFEHPYAELAFHPDWLPVEVSFLGRSGYAKSGADFGGAVSLGRRPWNYLRLVGYTRDILYDDKNDVDDSYYEREPYTLRLEGAYRLFDERLITRFSIQRETPQEFVDPAADTRSRQNAVSYEAFLDYRPVDGQLFGISLRGLRAEKSISDADGERSQELAQDGAGIYWQYTALADYEVNLGLRADRLRNTLREPDGGKDYSIGMPQVYGVLTHWYAPRQGWELGANTGRTWERTKLQPAGERFVESSNQGKLRTSWEYRSLDGRSRLMLHFSFNLDDLTRDPGDGAGMTYQGVF